MASDDTAKAMCCKQVWDPSARGHFPCSNPAKVDRDGLPYCGVHDPERVRTKQEERDAKMRAKIDANNLLYTRRRLEFEACDGVSDSDLRRVIEAGGLAAMLAKGGGA